MGCSAFKGHLDLVVLLFSVVIKEQRLIQKSKFLTDQPTFASGLTEITSQGSIQLKQEMAHIELCFENNSQGGLLKARDISGVETVTIDGADGSAFFADQIISGNGTSTDGHLTINRIGEHSNQKFIKIVSNKL